MKKVFILIMAVLTIHFATAQKLVGTYYDWNKIHPKEQYYVNSAGQKNGTYKMYDQNGVVIKEYNYLNGLENGTGTEYAALPGNQRVVKIKMNFKNGEADGSVVQYCEYDNFKSKVQEGKYLSGKKTGLWREWWCTEIVNDKFYGVLKSVGSYKNDLMDGQWTFYNNKGFKEKSGIYKEGVENGMWSYYLQTDSSKPISSGNYVNGVKVGEWTLIIDEELKITNEIPKAAGYRNVVFDNTGKMQAGQYTDFYLTGEKFRVGNLNGEGKESEIETRYYKNGKTLAEQDYKSGSYKEYFESGKIRREGNYSGEKEIGKWNSYYENGKVLWEEYYTNGNLTTSYKYAEDGELIGAYVKAYGYSEPQKYTYERILKEKAEHLVRYIVEYTGKEGKFVLDFGTYGMGVDYFSTLLTNNEPQNLPVLVSKNPQTIKDVLELNTRYSNTRDVEEKNNLMKQIISKLENIIPV